MPRGRKVTPLDAELFGELLDPRTGLIGSDELGDIFAVEPCLGLLRRTMTPLAPRRPGHFQERSEVFYLVRWIRISSHKLHFFRDIPSDQGFCSVLVDSCWPRAGPTWPAELGFFVDGPRQHLP